MIYGAPDLLGLVAAGWWATQFKSLPSILPWWILGILSVTGSSYSSHRDQKYKRVKRLNMVWLSIIGFFVSYQLELFFWFIHFVFHPKLPLKICAPQIIGFIRI